MKELVDRRATMAQRQLPRAGRCVHSSQLQPPNPCTNRCQQQFTWRMLMRRSVPNEASYRACCSPSVPKARIMRDREKPSSATVLLPASES